MNREMNHQFMKSPAYENCQLMNASVRQILKKKKNRVQVKVIIHTDLGNITEVTFLQG